MSVIQMLVRNDDPSGFTLICDECGWRCEQPALTQMSLWHLVAMAELHIDREHQ